MTHVTRSRLFRNIRAIGGNSPIRYGLCTGQISLPNSCKNRMQTTFSLSAERLHVRITDTELMLTVTIPVGVRIQSEQKRGKTTVRVSIKAIPY